MVSKSHRPSLALYRASSLRSSKSRKMALNLNAFQTGRKTAADQLHQQMQLHFPVFARLRAGDAEQARGPPFDEIADEQHRADAEVAPHRRIVALVVARLARYRAARIRAAAPAATAATAVRPRIGRATAPGCRWRACRAPPGCRRYSRDSASRRDERPRRVRVASRSSSKLTPMMSSAVAAVIDWKSTAILVQMTSRPTAGRSAALRPGLRGQYVRGGQVRVAGIVGCYCHAPSEVPEKCCGYRSTVCHSDSS